MVNKATFDPGLTQKYTTHLRRAINKDGNFNVKRDGLTWLDIHPYIFLINAPWQTFLATVFAAYFVVTLVFAAVYTAIGTDSLHGAEAGTLLGRFLNAFFFSAETLTTVGYGTISPMGVGANTVAAIEAMWGLLAFGLAAAVLFGRVSRPTARIAFSESMIVAPYQGYSSLQFRVANRRPNNLMEIDARVLLMTVERCEGGEFSRRFVNLELERDRILFFPLPWTIVHPITDASPLWGKTAAELEAMQAEVLILLRGYDDTFSQTVFSRFSYTWDEIKWGVRFAPGFTIDDNGDLRVAIDNLSQVVPAPLDQVAA